ncbi:MAG TPA: DUF721 domain-containing protein [Desulfobulbus sp.]|nr:DUF721 domain-containing protein [Desulfobulbus sp.]
MGYHGGMEKDKGPRLLGRQMERLYGKRGWHHPWQIFVLVREWRAIAGPDIAARTMPAYLRRDVLWVYVRNSAMMQHVQMQKPRLIQEVNQRLEGLRISDIRWVLEPADLPQPPARDWRPTAPMPDKEQEEAFRRMASTVADPGCRDALLALWRSFQRGPGREK